MRSKSFSVSKFGFEAAKALAIEYRETKLKELSEEGIIYSEQHGK